MTKNTLLEALTHFGKKSVAFEPVPVEDDDDELTKAINDPIYHDNQWDLHEDVDAEALESFWDEASQELESDTGVDSFTE